jgi:recombination protein RecT
MDTKTNPNAPVKQEPQTALDTVKKDVTAQVLTKIDLFQKSGELRLPADYSPENALKSAYLILLETTTKDGKPVLEACTKESIANSLLKMVVWGLSPLKKQCDFIAYGDKLQCDPEYTGNIVLAKRYGGLREINANVIFKGDEFIFENDPLTGRKRVVKHFQNLDTFGTKDIAGAYAVAIMNDGTTKTEVMTMPQIKQAWEQGATKGNSPAHRNFPDQMAIRTVINRACKLLIRASDDAVLYSDSRDMQDAEYEDVTREVEREKAQHANKVIIGVDPGHPDGDFSTTVRVDTKTGEITPLDPVDHITNLPNPGSPANNQQPAGGLFDGKKTSPGF